MMSALAIKLSMLWIAVVVSALAVVYVKHETRMLYVETQVLEKRSDDLSVEWGRLQLEQNTLAAHGRVENIARTKLGMIVPAYDEIKILVE